MLEHLPAILFLMLLVPGWYLVQRLCADPERPDAAPFACGSCARPAGEECQGTCSAAEA